MALGSICAMVVVTVEEIVLPKVQKKCFSLVFASEAKENKMKQKQNEKVAKTSK
jgi:hypothetical protein